MILFPWASTRLWNSRWNKMSFGPYRFEAALDTKGLKRRWAALYAVPFALIFFAGAAGALGLAMSGGAEGEINPGLTTALLGIFLLFYLGIPLATLAYFAKFYRKAAAATRIGDLHFGFEARTWDWLKLYLGNFALAAVTLGLGIAFWGYRNWSFVVRHTRLYGNVHLDDLTQTRVSAPGEAEGFADAFDVGAF